MFGLDQSVKTYLVELCAKREDGQEAKAYMKLFLNDPPRNGTCTITPSVGVVTESNFQVTCSGWIDEDGIESYRIYGDSFLLIYGNINEFNILRKSLTDE